MDWSAMRNVCAHCATYADEGSQGRQHGDCVRGRRHVVHDYGRGGGHVGAGRKAAQRAWYEGEQVLGARTVSWPTPCLQYALLLTRGAYCHKACSWGCSFSCPTGLAVMPVLIRALIPPQLVRLTSWLFILLGVSCLAGGTEALAATARAFASCLPPWAWRLLPRPVAVTVHKLQKQRTQQQHQQGMGSEEDDEGLEDLV